MAIDISKYKAETTAASEKGESKSLDFLSKDISLFSTKLPDKKKEKFYSELNILLSAGVDIKSAIDLIASEVKKEKEKKIFQAIHDKVVSGSGLSEAVQSTGKFSDYEYYSLQIGEESGKLNKILEELARYFNHKIQQKRKLVSALSYSVMILLTAVASVFFMLKFVVPMFADLFKRFKGDLPFLTKAILRFSDVVSDYSLYFFLLVILIVVFVLSQKQKLWFRKATSTFFLKIPLVGEMIKKIYMARFCHAMSLLLSSKTPLVNALDLVKKIVEFYPLESSLSDVRERIMKGESLSESLSHYPIYDRRMLSLIRVAEETNKLDMIFEKMANQHFDEIEYQTSMLGTIMEPFLIIFLGLLIGVILIAMYLPLFQLSSSMH
ncbi:MAG: type II secretion system F family protein [Bacteroidetes bacterium]|nr:type II secretion system F family protein [Bacteroidota bacterium]